MDIKQMRGVALVIYTPERKILVLQEYQEKDYLGKFPGMFSIPMETKKSGEMDYSALVRLCAEELPSELFELIVPLPQIMTYVGSYQVVPGVFVCLYSIRIIDTPDIRVGNPENKEVGNWQWISPEEALKLWLRQGAHEMIEDFMAGERDVCREKCCKPNLS